MIRNNCYFEQYLFLSQLFIKLARIFLYCGKNNVTGLTLLIKIEFLLRSLARVEDSSQCFLHTKFIFIILILKRY